jgi:hypothetical protein
MISICREHAGNARALAGRHDGAALVRWGMVEAATQFRGGNGDLHLPACPPRATQSRWRCPSHMRGQQVEAA